MKRFLTLLVLSLAVFSSVSFGQLPRRVPAGKTYVYLNRTTGKEISRRRAGQSTRATNNTTHCVKITCPDHFDKNTVCWSCTTTSAVRQQ